MLSEMNGKNVTLRISLHAILNRATGPSAVLGLPVVCFCFCFCV